MKRTIAYLVVSCVILAVGFRAETSFGAETFFQAWVNGVNIYNCYVRSPTEARVKKDECSYEWSEPDGFHEELWGSAMAWIGWFSASIDLIHDRGARLGNGNLLANANAKAFFVDMTITGPPGVSSVRAPICFELQGNLSANPSRTYPTTGVQNHALANFRGWVGTDVETDFNRGGNPSFVFQAWITETVGWSGLMGRPETERAVYQLNVATYPEISWASDTEIWTFGADTSVLCTTEMDLPVGVPHQVGLWLMAGFDGQFINTEWTTDNGRSSGGAYLENSLSFPIGEPVYRLPEGYTLNSESAGIVDNRWKFQDCNSNSVPDWVDIARGTILDQDLDGVLSGGGPLCPARDCDDNDPGVYPGAIDIIDGKDNDCDGLKDNLYDFITLYKGAQSSMAYHINDVRQLVGQTETSSGENDRAFLWSEEVDQVLDLGTLGGDEAKAAQINILGQVVGQARTASEITHAFLITPEDTDGDGTPDLWNQDIDGDGVNDLMIDLGTLGGNSSSAQAINDHGQVIGWASSTVGGGVVLITPEDTNGDGRPDVWNRDLNADGANDLMVELGTLGGTQSYARDINDRGQIVGTSHGPLSGFSHAFLWTEEDGMLDLGTLGGNLSGAYGINNGGQVVGVIRAAGNEDHAFLISPIDVDGDGAPDLWNQDMNMDGANDLMMDLGTISAEDRPRFASSINDLGQVVGYILGGNVPYIPGRAFMISPLDTDGDGVPDQWNRDEDADGANDLMLELRTDDDNAFNQAYSVNNLGQSVGVTSGRYGDRAVLWTGSFPLFTTTGFDVVLAPRNGTTGLSPVTLTFDEITTDGLTKLITTTDAVPPPYGFSLGNPPTHYSLSTSATYSGSIRVCIDYTEVSFAGSEADLRLNHFENGQWVEVNPQWVDIDNHTVCGDVTSLSLFAVFEPVDSDGDGIPDSADGCPGDPLKVEPGTCGCGVVDNEEDADSDGTPDCIDGCPLDPLNDADDDGICGDFDTCPDSDLSTNVVIQGCDSGVTNHMLIDGCTIPDSIDACAAESENHGDFVSCVSHLTNDLKKEGIISGKEKGKIQSCAAEADIP